MSLKSWLHGAARQLTVFALAVIAVTAVAMTAQAGTIKIGAPIPQTGPFASDGGVMEKAIKLAVEDLNKAGGVLGQQVEVEFFDIGDLSPDKLQAAAANLIDRGKADFIVTGYGGFGPDIPAFCPQGVPFIHNDAFTSVVDLMNSMGCTSIFNASDVESAYGKVMFDQIMALGHDFPNKKLAIVHGPYEWEAGLTKAMAEAAAAQGWEIVVNEEVPYESVQWPGILSKIRDANPSLVHIEVLDAGLTYTFLQQYFDNPVKGALLNAGYAASVPAFGDVISKGNVEGVLGMTLSAQLPGPDGDAFVKKWQAAYNEMPPWSLAAQLYDEVNMWAAAVAIAGSASDHAAVVKALKEMSFKGLTGTLKFDDRFKIPTSDASQPAFLFQVQGKDLKTLMIGTAKTADFVEPTWSK
jgi:ABC-type branched-subunit amino acid transport system substrate-binding protein